jgi:hypothetical protein
MSESGRQRRRLPIFEIVVAVLVLALAAEGFVLLRPKPKRPAEAQQAISAGQSQKVETFGEESAPIIIEFYAPLVLEWHQKTIGLLRKYSEEHPGRVFVKLMPMGQTECDAEMQERGYTCAVIMINGENEFKLPDGRKVELYQRPNQSTSTYNSEDVITILEGLSKGPSK